MIGSKKNGMLSNVDVMILNKLEEKRKIRSYSRVTKLPMGILINSIHSEERF